MPRTYIAVPVDPARAKEALREALSGYNEVGSEAAAKGYTGPPRILRLKDREPEPLDLKPGDWLVDTDDYRVITEVRNNNICRHYSDGESRVFPSLWRSPGPKRRMTPKEIKAFKANRTFPTNPKGTP